jgi:drug/metabolite transporter (DMT)-like permease
MIGVLTFVISLLRNISVNLMPGSVFSLLISTSILFNIVLSKLILQKVFTWWHLSAAFFCSLCLQYWFCSTLYKSGGK